MSELGDAFCLVCGDPPPLYGDRMCEPCLRVRTKLAIVPENVGWVRCARCGMTEIQGRWTQLSDEDVYDELIQRNVAFHERAEDIGLGSASQVITDRHTLLHLQIEGVVDDLLFQEEHTMRARRSNGVCITCTRKAGNYFEATVQLRSTGRKLEGLELDELRQSLDKVLDEMADDPMFFITSEGPVQGGYDVVLGSKGLARSWGRHLIKNHGGKVNESMTVVGRSEGVDVTRLTLLYRKPGYDLGDVIEWRGDLWRVMTWRNDGAVLTRIARRERTGATWRDLESAKVVSRKHEFIRVGVIQEDDSVAEFLDPENWTMQAVRKAYDHVVGEDLLLTKRQGEWLSLPKLERD